MGRKPQKTTRNGGRNPTSGGSTPQKRAGWAPAFAESAPLGGLGDEFAARGRLLQMSDLQGLPNPDPILRAEGKSLATYRRMVDGHLSSVMQKRVAAVRGRPWIIERGQASETDTERVREIVSSLDVRAVVGQVLTALGYGYSVQEIVWEAHDWIVPVSIIDRPPEWFLFGLRGETRFISESGTSEIAPARKLLVARHRADYLNPYGRPILSECFWPLAFKRGGLQFWMLFAERFGMPKTIGKMPPSTSEDERMDLVHKLRALVQDGVAVIPDNGSVDLLETKVSGVLPYPELVKWADSEMSKAWLGEVLSTELQGNGGSRAAAQVHNEVRADLALDDASMVEATMNELIRWIWEVNSLTGPRPRFEVQMPEDLKSGRLERDKGLYDVGLRFTSSYFQDTYGLAPEHIQGINGGAGSTVQDAGQAFGEPAGEPGAVREALLVELEGALTDSVLEGQADRLVDPVLELARKSRSFGEVADGLVHLVDADALGAEGFEDLLARVSTLAEGIGRMTDA